MKKIDIVTQGKSIPIIVEKSASTGILKIAQKSAKDIELVTNVKPEMITAGNNEEAVILYATLGQSPLLDELEQSGKLSFAEIRGKREVYMLRIVENPWEGTKKALIVAGSEKRGTIYGIFRLSEYFGVSPLVYWGDVEPVHREVLTFTQEQEMTSKEPSVCYRGFFINDEWPCFGQWTMGHFGGFNADMYDHVFELLLRLKGNYLWPAMWTSSFALDGPGEASAALADEYGIIMGNSHHEPCLRASEEWDIYKGDTTEYGSAWNYVANKDGLLNYWKDGLLRSSKYENIITIGMRGERDSMMEGVSTLRDNIEVLKDIITNQEKLIRTYADTPDRRLPRLLAIYKEVERYYYGDETTEGLRDWDGLDDVILMLCEDNFGFMRRLPDGKMRQHKGGFGMYYHLDYHGGPISYEWVNSTPLTKVWEEMTKAYEYGVQQVWVVNVGDLKGNEFPLSYFLNLAYDYEQWGISNQNSASDYTKQWVAQQFDSTVPAMQEEIAAVLTESIFLLGRRRPEAIQADTYHAVHYHEADKLIEKALELRERSARIAKDLANTCKASAYYSMVDHPLQSGMNLLLMNLYAARNAHYAKQGKPVANRYRDLVERAIREDRELSEKFGKAFGGKWKGMELESHIGFTKWNEDGCRYPLRMSVEPFAHPRLVVSRSDEEQLAMKNYGTPMKILVDDFLYEGNTSVVLEVANDGSGAFTCKVEQGDCDWLTLSWTEQLVEEQEHLMIRCKTEYLTEQEQIHTLYLTDGDTRVAVEIHGKNQLADKKELPPMTFLPRKGVFAIQAEHVAYYENTQEGMWQVFGPYYGRSGSGIKVFPVTKNFTEENGPIAVYRLYAEQAGDYTLEVWSTPASPSNNGQRLCYGVAVNDKKYNIDSVSETYEAGEPGNAEWCQGVLDQIRKNKMLVNLKQGMNEVRLQTLDAGFVAERIFLYQQPLKTSYLGPEESWFIR